MHRHVIASVDWDFAVAVRIEGSVRNLDDEAEVGSSGMAGGVSVRRFTDDHDIRFGFTH